MKTQSALIGATIVAIQLIAVPVYAICGDGNLERPAEQCDDGNTTPNDGCSALCTTEEGFVCEDVSFILDVEDDLNVSGTATDFELLDPRTLRQNNNSLPGVYSTTMPADIAQITFEMRVATTADDDFLGWTIGYDAGELSTDAAPPTTDWLYFSWKQGTQSAFGGSRQSGLIVSRVTGNVTEGELWSGTGANIQLLEEANNYPLAPARLSGWADNLRYRVRMVMTPNRIRVWIAEETSVGSGTFAAETLEFDITPTSTMTTTFPAGNLGFYVHSQASEEYELLGPLVGSVCSVDADGDDVKDRTDADSDNDGIPDSIESPGFVDDPDIDSDLDGIPDWNDPDDVPGGCTPDGGLPAACAELPVAIDADADGVPNHLDLDSDGDGINDAIETGATDANGDGSPDGCTSVAPDGTCDAGGLVGPAPNTDGGPDPDYLDTDSDGDGIDDTDEAFDLDGDQMANVVPFGNDADGDGLDDAFDPDCPATVGCAGVGTPLNSTMYTPAQDSNGDGRPDWTTLCGDAHQTGSEACDDGNLVEDDTCTTMCLRTNGEGCTDGVQCASALCDGTSMTCEACVDTGPGLDPGCSVAMPACIDIAGVNTCAPCDDDASGGGVDSGCDGAAPVCDTTTLPICVPCLDTAGPGLLDDGCSAGTPACDVSGATPICRECTTDGDCGAGVCVAGMCLACDDDMTGASVDRGCTAVAPLCDSGGPMCEVCLDDTTGGTDVGCSAALPVCASGASPNVCLACEDSAPGTDTDNGCDAATPVCDESITPVCRECTEDDHCSVGTVCGPAGTCVPGCTEEADCAGTPTPICDVSGRVCVECLGDSDCPGTTMCTASRTCEFTDTDGDTIPDDIDLDDDNDGVLDVDELGSDLSVDSDDDGVLDYEDPDFVGCDDDDDNGVCDTLPADVDFDGDGIANHLDLDADGDGIVDNVEAGGMDADGDGIVDDFVDIDGNGLDDGLMATPLPLTNTDGEGNADFLELDSDADGLPDATEGHDADHDGIPDVEPSGSDTDGDGLDDAFDPGCTVATCGLDGVPAPTPDLDGDMRPDFQDTDDDGDGRSTADELQDADDYEGPAPDSSDVDEDGLPNWFDTDSDDDGATDMSENVGDLDNDDNGILDYLDPNYAPRDSDGDGIADVDECPGVIPPSVDECPDSDGDGQPDYLDVDDDNDGILTAEEFAAPDGDGDGVPNHLDLDSDNDGIPDLWENDGAELDADGDGVPDDLTDADGDGLLGVHDPEDSDPEAHDRPSARNTDGSGEADYLDLDADNDGITDIVEALGTDVDGDGRVDDPADSDGNGLADTIDAGVGGTPWTVPDTDEDGTPDFQDIDSDGDGVEDAIEGHDSDADGAPDTSPLGVDSDGDGIDDAFDIDDGGTPAPLPDRDGDGTADYRDVDDDGDGVNTIHEVGMDTDDNGTPDYLDTDDDGDEIPTIDEGADPNGNNAPDDAIDSDGDGTPDYLDPNQQTNGGYSGGSFCAAGGEPGAALLPLLLFVAVRRRGH